MKNMFKKMAAVLITTALILPLNVVYADEEISDVLMGYRNVNSEISSRLSEWDNGITTGENIPIDGISYYEGHYYKVYTDAASWTDAKERCESLGGYLATITTKEEDDFTYALMQEAGISKIWFGLYNAGSQKDPVWCWVTDEPLEYTRWGKGQPDYTYNGAEAYGGYWQGAWNDYTHTALSTYICEWNFLPTYIENADDTDTKDTKPVTEVSVSATVNNPVYGKVICPSKVTIGEKVTYKAEPNVGYKFNGWYRNGELASKSNPYTFVADENNTSLEAEFSWDDSLDEDALARQAEFSDLPVLLLVGHDNKDNVNLKWSTKGINDTLYYEIYMSECDGKNIYKKVGTTNTDSCNIKKLNNKKAYKFFVAAYTQNGNEKSYVAKSIAVHVALVNYTKTNVKSISLKSSTISVKQGNTEKIKATSIKENKKKKIVDHAKEFRYETSNKTIATVDKKGVVKGRKKGSCTIYVIANNGVYKSVKVNVK